MRRWLAGSLLVLLLLFGISVTATGHVSISIDGSFETPEETVTVDGEEFTVTQVRRVHPGEEFDVAVSADVRQPYQINVYTLDEQVQDFKRGLGDSQVTFETEFLDPGSYLVAAVAEDGVLAVHPLTVSGYAPTVDAPSTVDEETPFDVTIQLEELDDTKAIGRVEVVVWNDETRERFTATQVDGDTYEATVDGLANASYDVYAVVLAEESVDGEDDVIGLSDPGNLTVREVVSTPTVTPTPTDGGTPTTPTGTTPATPTQTSPTTPTATPTDPPSTPIDTEKPTDANDDLITPGGDEDTASDDDDGSGFGVLTVFGALVVLVSGLLYARWGE